MFRPIVFVGLYATLLPYAWTLFVAGPGVLGTLVIVVPLGMAIGAAFKDWAFPRPLCKHCGASLEYAPIELNRRREDSRPEPRSPQLLPGR